MAVLLIYSRLNAPQKNNSQHTRNRNVCSEKMMPLLTNAAGPFYEAVAARVITEL